jgi:hypothetical protein
MQTGWALRELCDEHIPLNDSFVMSEDVSKLRAGLTEAILPNYESKVEGQTSSEAFSIIQAHFYPELLDAVVNEVETACSTLRNRYPACISVHRFSLQIGWRKKHPGVRTDRAILA